MTQEAETLTQLVAERVGEGRRLTYRAFEERAVDPETGHRPSRDVLWKLRHGKSIRVEPSVIRAVAVGLDLPRHRVQAAAAYQFLGLVVTQTGEGIAITEPGTSAPDADAVQRQAGRARDEGEDNSR